MVTLLKLTQSTVENIIARTIKVPPIVGVPAFLLYPFTYAAGRVDLFATKLNPETIGVLLTTRIALELVLGFLLLGCVTRLFLWRMEVRG